MVEYMTEADFKWFAEHVPRMSTCNVCGSKFYCSEPTDADFFCWRCNRMLSVAKQLSEMIIRPLANR